MSDEPRWKGPKPELRQDTSLFDVLGEEGEEFKVPIKGKPLEDAGPAITPKAQEALDEYNKTAKDDKKIEIGKIKGTGKDGKITAQDITRERLAKNPPTYNAGAVRTDPANKPEPDEYDKDRTVYYAGHQVPVPDRTMKLEDVRVMIEEQWPELSKENTDMIYDEERGAVIPVLKGHRKGGTKTKLGEVYVDVDAEDLTGPWSYVLAEDGYTYMLRRTQAGDFVTRMNGVLSVSEGFRLNVPSIPSALLKEAIEVFQSDEKTEMLCNFIWEATSARYHLGWPDQEGDASRVQAQGAMETEDHFIVLQLHSHGIMPAFFSHQDDADELRTGLYGVVGHCDKKWPTLKLRYSNAGEFRGVLPEHVFTIGWSGVVDNDGG